MEFHSYKIIQNLKKVYMRRFLFWSSIFAFASELGVITHATLSDFNTVSSWSVLDNQPLNIRHPIKVGVVSIVLTRPHVICFAIISWLLPNVTTAMFENAVDVYRL